MNTHQQTAKETIENLKKIQGISKIILYGSVLKEQEKKDSDIDIAIVLDDIMKGTPLDMEGLPTNTHYKIQQIKKKIEKQNKKKLHIVMYWESEYEKGILLESENKKPGKLCEEGKIVYDGYDN
ncbi:MAG: nucleotidyltransferase domain-containing protein [Nanoarchaeota archaeon]|nr:nucleotidyltransferase domain-containing protein [Nanoarchaeota archaeon]MBU1030055.1 nucleotidyltransferase domain-containing protein [Nanoarchaeota archaeon]